MELSDDSEWNPNKVLPHNIVIKTAGNHFYEIGLWQFRIGNAKRNQVIYHPLLRLIIQILLCLRSFISLLTKRNDPEFFVQIGDFNYFLNVRYQFNVCLMLLNIITMINIAIHYWYYKNEIWPSYMKLFEILSGFIPPKSIGLTDPQQIRHIFIKSRLLINLTSFNTDVFIPILPFVVTFIPIALHCETLTQMVIYGIPWSILMVYGATYFGAVLAWQITYFYLICYYLKLKLSGIRLIRDKILNSNSKQLSHILLNENKTESIMVSINNLYLEIQDYNNYWSKFAFMLYLFFSTIVCLTLYSVLFGDMTISIRFIFIYATIFFSTILITFLKTASSLQREAAKSYLFLLEIHSHLLNCRIKYNLRLKVY
jgi:hypothetical protein